METVRHHILSKLATLFTAVVFLNMSFFLAEVILLDFSDREMIENIASLVASSGFEEERDTEPVEKDSMHNGFDMLALSLMVHHTSLFHIGTKALQEFINLYPPANHAKTFTPPPEAVLFS